MILTNESGSYNVKKQVNKISQKNIIILKLHFCDFFLLVDTDDSNCAVPSRSGYLNTKIICNYLN